MIYIEGNKSANYFEVEQLDDNKIRIKFGDCCIHGDEVILTAEVISTFLMRICLENNTDLLTVMKSYMHWNKEINELYSKDCKLL